MNPILFFVLLANLLYGKDPRIVGGTEVDDTTTFPWIVAIINTSLGGDYSNRHFCGGSIISESWILTAAHCITDITEANEIAVLVGTYNLSDMEMGVLSNLSAVYIHEDFNSTTSENDIGLLELWNPLTLSDSVAIINRADDYDPVVEGQIYTMAGWGAINMNGTEYSPILNTVEVPDISLEVCADDWEHYHKKTNLKVYDTNLCAGGVWGEGSCYGDSGGPLLMAVDSTATLYGVISWAPVPCASAYPAVFTAVVLYQNWIDQYVLGTTDDATSHSGLYLIIGIVVGIVLLALISLFVYKYVMAKRMKKGEDELTAI